MAWGLLWLMKLKQSETGLFPFSVQFKCIWNCIWFPKIPIDLIWRWHIFRTFIFCSSQFCSDIRSQLENDFMKSLQAEVRYTINLAIVVQWWSWWRYCSLFVTSSCVSFASIFLRSLMVKRRLLDHCLGTLRILLGIQIFPACSWGRTRHLRGQSCFVWWYMLV